ncbi:MAG: polyprenyl synthetase family protein, partial [Clostridia bacterium]|nr:polyprenyl synthetase family protein [Clostridia bacterium]
MGVLMLEFFSEITLDLNEVEKKLKEVTIDSDPFINQNTNLLLDSGGKRLRPAFSLLGAKLANYDLSQVLPLAVAIEIFHMATLVHDDVVDCSLTRRGQPTVKALRGNRISTHLGNYLLAKALILFSQYSNPLIPAVMSEVSFKICQGELYQIQTLQDSSQNLKNYFYRINRKTAVLLAASCQLGAVACGAGWEIYQPLRRYGHCMGMAFQIADDILDFTATATTLGKPVGNDLKEGIITLPVIWALQDSPQKEKLRELLLLKSKSETDIA